MNYNNKQFVMVNNDVCAARSVEKDMKCCCERDCAGRTRDVI